MGLDYEGFDSSLGGATGAHGWSPRFFEILLNGIQDPVYVIDPADGFRICYANEAAFRHYGYSEERLLRMRIPDWDPNFPPSECDAIWAVVKEKRSVTFETLHNVSDGSTIEVEVTANYLEYGGHEYIAGFIKNITSRREAERKIRDLASRLAKSNAELEKFAYVASHDLREPLATLSIFAKLLERRHAEELTPAARKYVQMMVTSAERMRRLIDKLLQFSRVSYQPLGLSEVDCADVVREVLADLRASIGSAGASVEVGPLPTLVGDASQLSRLFQNLVSNAIKFRGEAAPRIAISAEPTLGGWIFRVDDNGLGIEETFKSRLFRPFQRGHVGEAIAGTGLGLAICTKIVGRHGGRIWVESEPGQGASFRFFLPCKPKRDDARQENQAR